MGMVMCYHIGQHRGRVFPSSQKVPGAVLFKREQMRFWSEMKPLQGDWDPQSPLCRAQAFDPRPPDSSLLRHMRTHSYDNNNHGE